MYTGKLIAWNPKEQRGLIEGRLTGEIYHFKGIDALYNTDLQDLKEGLDVFFKEVDNRIAYAVEPIISSFNRYSGGECNE